MVYVGRITRQKGLPHLLDAARELDPAAQLVLCASAPDTPELGEEVAKAVRELQQDGHRVLWIEEMLPRPALIQILTHATVFVCPSVYEPLGIVNLEAMACETAVVATRTGGIPEVVEDGVTGLLVPIQPRGDPTGEPADPDVFAHDIAERINSLLADPERAERYGRAGRARAVEHFGWAAIAERVTGVYLRVLGA